MLSAALFFLLKTRFIMQENTRGKNNIDVCSEKKPGIGRKHESVSSTKMFKSGITRDTTRKINRSSLPKNNILPKSSLLSNTEDLGEKNITDFTENEVAISQRKLYMDKTIKEKLSSSNIRSKIKTTKTPDSSINCKIKNSVIKKMENTLDANRSVKRTINQTNDKDKPSKLAGGFSKNAADEKELQHKGDGPSTLANVNLSSYNHSSKFSKRSMSTTYSNIKKGHTVKETKISRTADESQKKDGVHSQIEKMHKVNKSEPVTLSKPKLFNGKLKTVEKERQLISSDTLKKETGSRKDLKVYASSSKISNQIIKKHFAREGRERTRTWTISSTSEDNGKPANDLIANDASCKGEVFSSNNEERALNDLGGNEQGVRVGQENATAESLQKYNGSDLQEIAQTKENLERPNDKIIYQLGTFDDVMNKTDNVTNSHDEYIYEDDFEEYESDFEECSEECGQSIEDLAYDVSSLKNELVNEGVDERNLVANEEMFGKLENESVIKYNCVNEGKDDDDDVYGERMMDSGLYDDSQGMRRRRHEEHDNLLGFAFKGRLDADEGFDEKESIRMAEEKNLGTETTVTPASCVNCEVYFCKREPLIEEMLKTICGREKQLLQMIALDEISYSLFELPPVPYEAFVRTCGAYLNVKHVSVQTNEDTHSEEIQTDPIVKCHAWTQKPPVFGSSGTANQEISSYVLDAVSWKRLDRFMELAGEVMLIILEEQWTNFEDSGQESSLPINVFSKCSIKLGQHITSSVSWESLTISRAVHSVCFSKSCSNLLVCVHGPILNGSEENLEMSARSKEFDLEEISDSSLLSVWSVSEPSFPRSLLSCRGNVSSTCFGPNYCDYGQLVIAGAENGSLSLWNMNEKRSSTNSMCIQGSRKQFEATFPTFSTDGPGEKIHLGRIVGLEPVIESNFCAEDSFSSAMDIANQICSLDEWGKVVIWSVIRRRNVTPLQTVGLVASVQICLGETKWLSVDSDDKETGMWNSLAVDRDWILAASDLGCVVRLPIDGDDRSSKLYLPPKDYFASAECVAVNPQGLPFFMVGNSLGQVHLYGHASERSIGLPWEVNTSLQHPPSPIVRIAWSPQRPFVFFSVDALSRMFVWDLSRSDIFPLSTIPPPDGARITSISLSTSKCNVPVYMAVGMSTGEVVLHQLKEEFCHSVKGTDKLDNIHRDEERQFLDYMSLR